MIPPLSLEIAVVILGVLIVLFEAFAEKIDKRAFALAGVIGLSGVLL